jgi:hypothetical protein
MINLNDFKPIRFIKRESCNQWNIDIEKKTLQHPQVNLICNVQCVLSIRELLRQEFEGRADEEAQEALVQHMMKFD